MSFKCNTIKKYLASQNGFYQYFLEENLRMLDEEDEEDLRRKKSRGSIAGHVQEVPQKNCFKFRHSYEVLRGTDKWNDYAYSKGNEPKANKGKNRVINRDDLEEEEEKVRTEGEPNKRPLENKKARLAAKNEKGSVDVRKLILEQHQKMVMIEQEKAAALKKSLETELKMYELQAKRWEMEAFAHDTSEGALERKNAYFSLVTKEIIERKELELAMIKRLKEQAQAAAPPPSTPISVTESDQE